MRPARGTLGLALALAATAALFDAEPLWVPAVALAALTIGAWTWVALGARGVQVRRTIAIRRVVEDEVLQAVLEVRSGRLALPGGRLVDPLLPEPVAIAPGRRAVRITVQARFARRGRRRLEAAQLVVSDPLGLAERVVRASGEDEILVLPRVEPVHAVGSDGRTGGLLGRGFAGTGAQVDVDGVRPLRAGTPATRIFWPAVARGAEPQERRLSTGMDTMPTVVLDPSDAASSADLDAAVRAAASLVHELARAGGCALLLPGDRRPALIDSTLSGWSAVHARLALLDGGRREPALSALAQRHGAVVLVSARMRTRLPPALVAGATAPRVLVVPGKLPGRGAAFAVAGCHGYVFGTALARGGRRRRMGGPTTARSVDRG